MKNVLLGIMLLGLVAVLPVRAAEMHGDSKYCTKHCNTTQLRKQVTDLEAAIKAEKAEAMTSSGSDKMATLMARKEQVKKHLAQHQAELQDLMAELDKSENDLKQMEMK